jgi:hypothetical protein
MRKPWACCLLAVLASGCSRASTQSSESSTTAPAITVTATPKPSPSSAAATKKASTREEMVKDLYLEAIYESEPALKSAGADEDLVSIGQGILQYAGRRGCRNRHQQLHPDRCWLGIYGTAVGSRAWCSGDGAGPQCEDKMSLQRLLLTDGLRPRTEKPWFG